MKSLRFLSVIAMVLICANAFCQIRKCRELKEEIEAKLRDKGATGFSLGIVPADRVKDQKIVGSCDSGKNKITYVKIASKHIAVLPKPTIAEETLLFANFELNASPPMRKGGWRIGGSEKSPDAVTTVGLLIIPEETSSLNRVEIVVRREYGGERLDGNLMTDSGGPDNLIETLPFMVPAAASILQPDPVPTSEITPLFQRSLSIHEFSGIPIIFFYRNFQEFFSIFKGILRQV